MKYKDPNHTESQIRPSTDKIQIRLRVLKINDGVHSLPRPSRKGNLANVVLHRTCLHTCPGYIPKTAISTGWYLARLDVKLRQLVVLCTWGTQEDLEDAPQRQAIWWVKRQRARTRERTYRDTHNLRTIEKGKRSHKETGIHYTNITQPNTILFTYRVEAM